MGGDRLHAVFDVTIPFYGKLSDVYGRKVLLLIVVGLFIVRSRVSGLTLGDNG